MSDQEDKLNKYVDLKINGSLFPSWLNLNFKKYKLEEVFLKPGEDPCKIKSKDDTSEMKQDLRKYQVFLSQFLDFRSPYKKILLYHGLGSGKTSSAINIYNALYNYTPGWNVFLLIKASLKVWLDELKNGYKKDEYEYRYKNIIFIHYDSPFADRNLWMPLKMLIVQKNHYI